MNVFYNTCVANPWLDVAQKLRDEHGWEPVYWNGYHDDDSHKLIPEIFPDCIYHPYHAGWKGIFPEAIRERYHEGALDVTFLRSISKEELLAMRMMDRMDMDRCSFNTMERQRHFRNLLRQWNVVLDDLKPEVVVSAAVPHRVFDYALYLLCKHRKIPYLMFRESAFGGRYIGVTDVASIGDLMLHRYNEMRKSDIAIAQLKTSLPLEIKDRYEKVLSDYEIAEPDYMKKHLVGHKRSAGFVGLAKKFVEDVQDGRDLYFGEEGFVKKGMSYLKVKGVPPEKSRMSIAEYAKLKMANNRYKKELKAHYESLTSEPDWEKPYVILNLHYQPEMTTNPSGDIFADQSLAVDALSRHLPKEWLIYVKEHRGQFYSHMEGHTARMKSFYDDLIRFPKVRLLSVTTDPFESMRSAKAVATITGTTGWEGMVLGKPIIFFGLAWYEKYDGVLKVTDEQSAARIPEFLQAFEFNERNLFSYLAAFADDSVRAYTQRGQKGAEEMERETCVNNLSDALIKMLNNARS